MKRNLRFGLLVATLMLLIAGCTTFDESRSDVPVTTRITADVGGILVERDGCFRFAEDASPDSPSQAIVWQKDIFEFERVNDELRIVDVEIGSVESPTVWKIGEEIRTSGGQFTAGHSPGHEEFLQRCEGPYIYVSGARHDSKPLNSK